MLSFREFPLALGKAVLVSELVKLYRAEKMPPRYSTRRSYESWLKNYILPRWGELSITEMKARPVELWLQSLSVSPKSRLIFAECCEFCGTMPCGAVKCPRNGIPSNWVRSKAHRTAHGSRAVLMRKSSASSSRDFRGQLENCRTRA